MKIKLLCSRGKILREFNKNLNEDNDYESFSIDNKSLVPRLIFHHKNGSGHYPICYPRVLGDKRIEDEMSKFFMEVE